MSAKTCAACNYNLEGKTIKVKIGRETIEVCCEECAQKLKEADPAKVVGRAVPSAPASGPTSGWRGTASPTERGINESREGTRVL